MNENRNGIPVDVPHLRKKQKVTVSKVLHPDFNKYKTFATMYGLEDGFKVIVVVPIKHPDFKALKKQGYRILEIWERKQKGEIA